ncbi:MAG: VTT domain-containing protein, partial [Candidatus Yanofskybacteria bacterium]|nr:VTT domain-containing protein [Candidatus Yanofskybacteria bacterium]
KIVGYRIFNREKSLLFSKDHIQRAEKFFDKYGAKTIIIARFTPIVRTLAPILAGIGKMKYRIFLTYNVVGGLIWGVGIPLSGYYLGQTVPGIDKYLFPLITAILVVSSLPTIIHLLRNKQHRQELLKFLRLRK